MFVSGDGAMEYRGQWRGILRHGQGTLFQKDLFKYTGVRDREGIHMHCLASEQKHRYGFQRGQDSQFQRAVARRAPPWAGHAVPEGTHQVHRCASQHHEPGKTLTCIRWPASTAQASLCARSGQGDAGVNGTACCVMATACCSRRTSTSV